MNTLRKILAYQRYFGQKGQRSAGSSLFFFNFYFSFLNFGTDGLQLCFTNTYFIQAFFVIQFYEQLSNGHIFMKYCIFFRTNRAGWRLFLLISFLLSLVLIHNNKNLKEMSAHRAVWRRISQWRTAAGSSSRRPRARASDRTGTLNVG